MVSRTIRALAVMLALLLLGALPAAAAAPSQPPPPQRLGYCGGDDWEPAMAIQGSTVVVAITHYVGDTTCDPASGNQADIYTQVSSDGGKTFSVPHIVWNQAVGGTTYPSQADPSVAIDPAGNVYVAFLGLGANGGHTDIIVAKSTNHGATFSSAVKANAKDCKNCDHEKLVVSGSNIYMAYSQAQYHFIAMSTDAGATWTQSTVDATDVVGFAEAGVVDSRGNVYFAWADCQSSSCGGVPAADYRVSKTLAGTLTTTFTNVATGVQGPDCPFSQCGFSYWGPQDGIGIDGNGNLYLVWQQGQASATRKSPPIVNLSRSTDGGATWTFVGRVDDKTASGCAGSACYALYPTIVGGAGTTIDVAWMDDRNGSPIDHTNGWNLWLRTSTNGGSSWTGPSQKMSFYDPSQSQSHPSGFEFPYGDYFGLAINSCGSPALTWGEGHDWLGGASAPGHIEFRTLC
jgi:hypothetical protein